MQELFEFLLIDEVERGFLPDAFIGLQRGDQIWIIAKLGVHNFDILLVFDEQLPHVIESLLHLLCEWPDSFRLSGTDCSDFPFTH